MSDLKLDSSGDLLINNNLLELTDTIEEDTSQRLSIKLKTFRGEWYLDLSEGIPYFQRIFKNGTPKQVVDSIFRSAINSDEQIQRITSFSSEITNSVYRMSFQALSNSGELVNLTQEIQI